MSKPAAVVFAYDIAPDQGIRARMAVAARGQVNMTALFDPVVPSPAARQAINTLLGRIRQTEVRLDDLLNPLAVDTVRKEFYEAVAGWVGRVQQGLNRTGREAVLRHLIRILFSWILKEEGRIPAELFERAFIEQALGRRVDDYHGFVLRFLFHRRLNLRLDQRDAHDIDTLNEALDRAPFLNGSLFAQQDGDDEFSLRADDYWSIDQDEPGLFTILSRYHWTMDEHRPGESEQTLDPELLSNLFERLIATTEEGDTSRLIKQPKGTYYTPSDIVDEMVGDALTAATKDTVPSVSEAELLVLYGDNDAPPPESLNEADKEKLIARIRELRIFDPAVGSGAFLFSMLLAIRRTLNKLTGEREPVETIIRNQLRGQDINPLAVQIARLRLFIAIESARIGGNGTPFSADDGALPNLEAIIVCADTLETVADPNYHPARLDMAHPEIPDAVAQITENRRKWFDVHSDLEKHSIVGNDETLRAKLKLFLHGVGELASPELRAFAEIDLLSQKPARTDARLLFYESPWRGFDIVIGNPPYENIGVSISAEEKGALKHKLEGGEAVPDRQGW